MSVKLPKIEELEDLEGMKRVYVTGSRPDVKVPFREIELQPTRQPDGKLQTNEPVRVYDTSGPWGDLDFHGDVRRGLPPASRGVDPREGRYGNLCGSVRAAGGQRAFGIEWGRARTVSWYFQKAEAREDRICLAVELRPERGDHARNGVYCDSGEHEIAGGQRDG